MWYDSRRKRVATGDCRAGNEKARDRTGTRKQNVSRVDVDSWKRRKAPTLWETAVAKMLQEPETSRDSLSSGSLAQQSHQCEWESTLGMHAELGGVVYLTPPTSQPSTSTNLSKPVLPAGSCPSKCHRRRVKGCVCVCVWGWHCLNDAFSTPLIQWLCSPVNPSHATH